jgi:hypothetical protein
MVFMLELVDWTDDDKAFFLSFFCYTSRTSEFRREPSQPVMTHVGIMFFVFFTIRYCNVSFELLYILYVQYSF